jgi:hypothetical protein
MNNLNLQTTDVMLNPECTERADVVESSNTQDSTSLKLRFGFFRFLGLVLGRSLFPITALVIIGGTIWWGPWISLVLAFSWFIIVLMWIG